MLSFGGALSYGFLCFCFWCCLVLSGSVSDNVGVIAVRVAVRDRNSTLWLQADGVTLGWTCRSLSATLDAPGSKATGWRLAVSLAGGAYGVQIKAEDAAGNRDASPLWVAFSVARS